jgi:tetratricopeptide (TPR) repeat protein
MGRELPQGAGVSSYEDLEARISQANIHLHQSQDALAKLRALLRTALTRVQALSDERKSLSFDALSDLNASAVKKLESLNLQSGVARLQVENYESAVQEAEQRLKSAESAANIVQEQVRATAALADVAEMKQAGLACDGALSDFLLALDKLEQAAIRINRTTGGPSRDAIRVYSKRAITSALMARRNTFDVEHLAPSARTSYSEICIAWGTNATVWCKSKLNGSSE